MEPLTVKTVPPEADRRGMPETVMAAEVTERERKGRV